MSIRIFDRFCIFQVSIIAFDSSEIFAVPIAWKHKRMSSSLKFTGVWYFQRENKNVTLKNEKWSSSNDDANVNYFSSDNLSLSKCNEPTNLNQQLMEWYQESASKRSETADQRSRSKWDRLRMEPEICRLEPSVDTDSDIMERALCPWEWKLNRDENREPKIISEAHCSCRRSRGSSSADCIQIQREFPVLKRVRCNDDNNSFQYLKTYETITVGCHSVMPRIRRSVPSWLPKVTNV